MKFLPGALRQVKGRGVMQHKGPPNLRFLENIPKRTLYGPHHGWTKEVEWAGPRARPVGYKEHRDAFDRVI